MNRRDVEVDHHCSEEDEGTGWELEVELEGALVG
jgi:hypothetical protein